MNVIPSLRGISGIHLGRNFEIPRKLGMTRPTDFSSTQTPAARDAAIARSVS